MNIGVIGVGRLGLAYALCFEECGFDVFASSYKADYVEFLAKKQTDSVEPGIAEMLHNSKNIEFTTDNHDVIEKCDIVYVMVATPSTDNGDYDVSAVIEVVHDYLNHKNSVADKILIIGSTVNPGTTDIIQEMLEPRGVQVVYMPTFSAQGSVLQTIQHPHTISIGTKNTHAAEQCRSVFSKLTKNSTPIYVMQPTTAEILKLAGNCRSTMLISFANMVGQILINSGMEKDLDVARDYLSFVKQNAKWQFGFGYGGPCYPRDNRSLIHYAGKIGLEWPLGELIDNFNNEHVEYLTNFFLTKNVDNLPFYFEYVSYKKGVVIFEESHQLKVCKNLLRTGAKVYIEPTKFLLPLIQEELTQEFDNVKFVPIELLEQKNISVFKVTF